MSFLTFSPFFATAISDALQCVFKVSRSLLGLMYRSNKKGRFAAWLKHISSLGNRIRVTWELIVASLRFGYNSLCVRRKGGALTPLLLLHVLIVLINFFSGKSIVGRSKWPRGLRRRSVAARLLRSWVRTLRGDMDVCLLCVLCVVR